LGKYREYNAAVRELHIDFRKANYLVRREVFYNIHIELGG